MTGDALRKPSAGEPFQPSARAWGAFIDAARAVDQLKRQSGSGDQPLDAGGWVWIKNESGADVARGGVLMPTGVVINPTTSEEQFLQSIQLTTDVPDDAPPATLITMQPIGEDEFGRAWISGLAIARITGDSGKAAASADDGDSDALHTGDDGFPLLYEESGTSERWGVVLLGGGGSCDCAVQIEFYAEGEPTSGTFTWRFGNPLGSNDLVINFDDNTSEVVTAMNALAGISDVTAITPDATALPFSSIIVELAAGTALPQLTAQGNTFDDGRMKVRYRP